MYLETEPTKTIDHFYIDLEKGCIICIAEQVDPKKTGLVPANPDIDYEVLCRNLDDTTDSMYNAGRCRDYTEKELVELSKKYRRSKEES